MTTAALAAALALPTAAAAAHASPTANNPADAGCRPGRAGRPVSVTTALRLSRAQVSDTLTAGGLPSAARYGVTAYRLTYCTTDPRSRPTLASGLLVLPQGRRRDLDVVSYDHSTAADKSDVPSRLTTTEDRLVPLFFAADGFAVSAPDYVGLGASPGLHPYLQATTEASATIDLLDGVDRSVRRLHARLSHTVLLTGFSQGGQAAMATGQALQRSATHRHRRWQVAALAPISGPYDLEAEFPVILDPAAVDPHRAAGYVGYVLTAWNRLYHLYGSPADVFTEPTAGRIDELFDGHHEIDAIAAALPPAQGLLRPHWQRLVERPTGRLARAIGTNQVCHWAPRAPTRLYASHGDRDVVFANARTCQLQIERSGGHAQVEDMGDVDHVGTALASLPPIRDWFERLADLRCR